MSPTLDWNTVIASVLASTVLSSVITGVISPSINWGIEKKRQTRADHKKKIQKWRQMVTEITFKTQAIQQGQLSPTPNVRSQAGYLIEIHPDFLSLHPLLQEPAKGGVFQSMTIHASRSTPGELIHLATEIDRIEAEWGLR